MRRAIRLGAALCLVLLLAACAGRPAAPDQPAAPAATPAPATPQDPRWPLSYTLGYNVGGNLVRARDYTDLNAFGAGLDDAWQHRATRLDEAQMRQAMEQVAQRLANPAAAPAPDGPGLPADFSYALGASVAASLQPAQDRIDPEVLKQAAAEAYAGKAAQVDAARRVELVRQLHADLQQQRQAASAGQGSEEFLADNAKHPGVKVTASGLQYEVLQQGQGGHPTPASRVTVNYVGRLLNGAVFDDGHGPGRPPASFRLANVIAGWTEGVQLMAVGSRYRFYIPPRLAYGERGAPPAIGPGQVLIFDVQLVAIE